MFVPVQCKECFKWQVKIIKNVENYRFKCTYCGLAAKIFNKKSIYSVLKMSTDYSDANKASEKCRELNERHFQTRKEMVELQENKAINNL